MADITITDGSSELQALAWVDPTVGTTYYSLIGGGLDTLADLLNTEEAHTPTWVENPDGVLHDNTPIGFARYAASLGAKKRLLWMADYEVLDNWPASPNVAGVWKERTISEPTQNGEVVGSFWRACEPVSDPKLPWSAQRVVELHGVPAASPVSGGRSPFPPAPTGSNETLWVSDAADSAPDWNSVLVKLSTTSALPRAIVGRWRGALVWTGNPVVVPSTLASGSTDWVRVFGAGRSATVRASRLVIDNLSDQTIEVRFGTLSVSTNVAAGSTWEVPIGAQGAITLSWSHPLELKRTASSGADADVRVLLFLDGAPGLVEV